MKPKKIKLTDAGQKLVAHIPNFREAEQLYMIEDFDDKGYAIISVDEEGGVTTHMHTSYIIMEEEDED